MAAGELARIFGVSRKHIYTMVDRGMPRQGRLFDIAECVQWQLQWVTEQASKEDPETMQEVRAALYKEQTEKLELDNAKTRRDQVSLAESQQVLLSVASIVAGQLDAMGPRLAPQVLELETVGDVQDAIFRECRDVRRAIADEIDKLDPDGDEDHPATDTEDSRSVGGPKKNPAGRKPRARKVAK